MKNKFIFLLFLVVVQSTIYRSQNSTFSPYSRYGLGDISPTTFAHNAGMGGTYVAYKPDSIMPIFINAGNPAAYALIKLTCLEVGGTFVNSKFTGNNSSLTKWSTNFAYGSLGFPVRSNGGACFGIMPFSSVGYDLKNTVDEQGIGTVNYLYSGSGGLNKAFLGYGLMPFQNRLKNFRKKNLYIADSIKHLSATSYKIKDFGSKLLSDFSLGLNVNYLFGSIQQNSRVIYPNSLNYNNTFRESALNVGDFTGNFGAQTAITIDSVKQSGTNKRRALNEKVKFTFGYFMALNNTLKVKYDATIYNYILNGFGQEITRDTVLSNSNQKGNVTLPLEQGFGLGFKKGERINLVADFAITNWSKFNFLDNVNTLKDNYRVGVGVNFVPEKYAAGSGAFFKKLNYRFGVSYQTGYINVNKTTISNYAITTGVGFPVGFGRMSSMVNISAQYGQMGTTDNNLIKENYWKINFGFTFSDRWFQKFRYD
ncbi:MAG: hypothetical protein Q7W45_18250 [Bacteroidota bacterium]|nr:hypothetical protein [Bacteroidota bacterium]MDP3147475.1 hypothetical protein [Bacteroidota bacterium]MDP3557967.1 hypothetical protein [Bacteroidota bacterium]